MILLLDGLDEHKTGQQREVFVQQINRFMEQYPTVKVAITCRTREFDLLTIELKCFHNLYIQPLNKEQIIQYLHQINQVFYRSEIQFESDDELDNLGNPLILSLIGYVYHTGMAPLRSFKDKEQLYQELFSLYIHRALQEGDSRYGFEETIHHLSWLAAQMSPEPGSCAKSQYMTSFFIEDLQPYWLPEHQRNRYKIVTA
jgi:hypothetical protein